jgi:DNA-binding response OmpR family regulator
MTKRVWIIEDDPDIGDIICILLTEDGHEVTLFSDAKTFKDALEIETTKPDLFLMDVMLPDGNGVDLCEATKGDTNLGSIPVLIMSAHAGFAAIKQLCSADDFISKPFDIDELSAKVKKLVNKA